MDQHEWGEWPDDSSSLGDHDSSLGGHDAGSLVEPDTVDLGDPGAELPGGETAGDGAGGYGVDDGFGAAGYGDDADARDHSAPLPDDTFDGSDSADLGSDADLPTDAGAGGDDAQAVGDAAAAGEEYGPEDHGSPDAPVDALVGADPDVDPHADSDWQHDPFPAAVEVADPPPPIDGYPWTDASTLGGEAYQPTGGYGGYGAPPTADLLDYAGLEQPADGDAWAALLGSDDPATSSLARWWGGV